MNNNLILETPIVFKHTIDLDRFPQFNRMSEEAIKTMLTEMIVSVFMLKEKEIEVNEYNSGTYVEVVI